MLKKKQKTKFKLKKLVCFLLVFVFRDGQTAEKRERKIKYKLIRKC